MSKFICGKSVDSNTEASIMVKLRLQKDKEVGQRQKRHKTRQNLGNAGLLAGAHGAKGGGARAHSTDHITTLLPEDSCDDNDDDDGDDEEFEIVFMNGLMQ